MRRARRTIPAALGFLRRFVVGKCRPLTYAAAYILAIPAFAAYYDSIADDFHHSTAKYELSLSSDLAAIQAGLDTAFNRTIKAQHGDASIIDHGWKLSTEGVRVDTIKYEDGIFTCSLMLCIEYAGDNGPEKIGNNGFLFSIRKGGGMPTDAARGMVIVHHQITFNKLAIAEFDPRVLLLKLPAGMSPDDVPVGPILSISGDLDAAMAAYANAMDGFPSRSSGGFGRMFYLSAVTITTLGFGDILPISARARWAVALEAVAGIVLIGYYLASLSAPRSPVDPAPAVVPPPPTQV